MTDFPLVINALRIEQPLGVFFVAVLKARTLLEVAYSDVLSAHLPAGEASYELDGTQRLVQPKRLQVIADYINRTDAAFPNSIILAANFRKSDGLIEDDEPETDETDENQSEPTHKSWTIEEQADGCCKLHIPTGAKLAAIIDGQHRLFAFAQAKPVRLDMDLLCSVFIDLPKPIQAQLFATINSTQKPVDKSQTYELFGYNVEDEDEAYWSPDKLAVFFTRKLGIDEKSPLKGKIIVAPKKDHVLTELAAKKPWKVSTAVVVEGIMRLYTTNPKKDTTNLLEGERKRRTALRSLRNDKSPIREVYLTGQDAVIYTMVLNYLNACESLFWSKAKTGSFIVKTVGVQALLDILRSFAADAYAGRDISAQYFVDRLNSAKDIDFAEDKFRNASGSGRSFIRKSILAALS
ncbi:MAG: DNA phosphorothioation-associated DGQHR protein 1 [Burkholderiaceae bacterium]